MREGNIFGKGERIITDRGYVLVRVKTSRAIAGVHVYAYEHRVNAEKKLGRSLDETEIVHHINGDKTDNRIENLEIVKSDF